MPNDAYELFAFGGWFDGTFGRAPAGRLQTWRAALALFAQRNGAQIVETGCQRQVDDWGAGCSTHILSATLRRLGGGQLHSVDDSDEHLRVARAIVGLNGAEQYVQFHLADSIMFLADCEFAIDFLYLDSLDCADTASSLVAAQEHQLQEIEAAANKLSSQAIVLLDDNHFAGGGKTRAAKRWLAAHGWLCVLDWQQSLWMKP